MSKIPHNKKSYKEVIDVIESQGYIINGNFKYDNERSKVDICDKYGYRYLVEFRSIIKGVTQRIVGKNNPYSIYNINLYIKLNNIKSKLISTKYISNKDYLEFECECGEHYLAKWDKFQQGYKRCCRKCSYNKRIIDNTYTIEDIKKYIIDNNIDVELLSNEYISIYEPLCFKCSCGEIYYCSFDKFKNKNQTRCKICSKTKSQYCIRLEEYLKSNNIKYLTEISFDECINPKTSHKLFFDYGIYKDDELCLIEVDGEYHYKDVVGRNELLFQQQRDKIKDKYCKENNIKLIRIPYWEFDKNDSFKNKLTHILKINTN